MLDAIDAALYESCRGRNLQNYYDSRAKNRRILNETDRALVEYIVSRFPPGTRVHEFAAGIGQVSIALSVLGFSVTMSEVDRERIHVCRLACERVGCTVPIFDSHWQNLSFAPAKVRLLICVNAVNSANDWDRDKKIFERFIAGGGEVLFDPTLYGTKDGNRKIDSLRSSEIGFGLWRWHV